MTIPASEASSQKASDAFIAQSAPRILYQPIASSAALQEPMSNQSPRVIGIPGARAIHTSKLSG